MNTVLSPFLHTVDDSFRDLRPIACYFLADRYFQLGDSLGIIFIYSSFQVSPEK